MYLIEDDTKKESKRMLFAMICDLVLIVWFIIYNNKYRYKANIYFLVILGLVFLLYLYGYIVERLYTIRVTEDAIEWKVIGTKKIDFKDIVSYSSKRFRMARVLFGRFIIKTSNKRFIVITRYIDEFESILKEKVKSDNINE